MGLTELFARCAVQASRVLVVEAPGQWTTRIELEQQLSRRGWSPAWTPAAADVLAVCGVPGPDLSGLTDRLFEQMPGPRVRVDISSPTTVKSALDDAAIRLLDTAHHRTDAERRAQKPEISHGDMHDGDSEHGEMDHGDMGMAPGGIPLAQGGKDRDGLEMDVLHLPLGPVLPFWPSGLVLHCSLQGDVVVGAHAALVDGGDRKIGGSSVRLSPATAAVLRCDHVLSLLALAGAEDAAACARRARNELLCGDAESARVAVERLHRKVRRSRLLRWSLRDVLPLNQSDVERRKLPTSCAGDAYDRLLSRTDQVRNGALGVEPLGGAGVVSWAAVPDLVTGLDVASVRLAVASLELEPFSANPERVGHD